MSGNPAKKIRISSQPPKPLLESRPPPRLRTQPSRHDSDTDYLSRREEAERTLAQEVDEYLNAGRQPGEVLPREQVNERMRKLIDALADDYEFLNHKKFVDELCERIERFPESRSKVVFMVSIFAIYEFTSHQDLAMQCADFCIRNSHGNPGMASVCSTILCRIADNCACMGAGPEMCQSAILQSMELSSRFENSAFQTLRAISEVSTFCRTIRIKSSEDSKPGIAIRQLPLQQENLFFTFLAAFGNINSYAREHPPAVNDFIASCMDMARAWRAELFVSAVSVLAFAALLDAKENEKYVRETIIALQSWDREYLAYMEAGLSKEANPPGKR
jgi:hypothetical protein